MCCRGARAHTVRVLAPANVSKARDLIPTRPAPLVSGCFCNIEIIYARTPPALFTSLPLCFPLSTPPLFSLQLSASSPCPPPLQTLSLYSLSLPLPIQAPGRTHHVNVTDAAHHRRRLRLRKCGRPDGQTGLALPSIPLPVSTNSMPLLPHPTSVTNAKPSIPLPIIANTGTGTIPVP